MCEHWRHDFLAFLADMGKRPIGMSLDRINTDGDYEPTNCRWATATTQIRTRTKRGKVITKQLAEDIRQLHGCGSSRAVAKRFGVGKTVVLKIWRGEMWLDA
jgi:hypothetical protein